MAAKIDRQVLVDSLMWRLLNETREVLQGGINKLTDDELVNGNFHVNGSLSIVNDNR